MDWIWLIVALLVGLAVGGLVAWTVVKRRYGDRESVAELRTELDRYKGKVTEHFVETADLVNTLTRNYKRVYDHLEAGAYELVGEDTLRRELDAPAEAPVMLEYLGQRRPDGGADAHSRTSAGGVAGSDASEGTAAGRAESAPRRASIQTKVTDEGDAPANGAPSEGEDRDPEAADRSDAEDRTRSAG